MHTTKYVLLFVLTLLVGCDSLKPQPKQTEVKSPLDVKPPTNDPRFWVDPIKAEPTPENTTPFVFVQDQSEGFHSPQHNTQQTGPAPVESVSKDEFYQALNLLRKEMVDNKCICTCDCNKNQATGPVQTTQVQTAQIQAMQQQSQTLQMMLRQQTEELRRQAYEREKERWSWYTGAVIYVSDPEKTLRGERTDCVHCDNLISGIISKGWAKYIGLTPDSWWVLRKAESNQGKPVIEYWENGKVVETIVGYTKPLSYITNRHYHSKSRANARKLRQTTYSTTTYRYVKPQPVICYSTPLSQPVPSFSVPYPSSNCVNGVCY